METLALHADQKKKILEFWNERADKGDAPSIQELAELIFGKGTKGSSKKGRLIKDFLGDENITTRGSHVYVKKTVDLTDQQKEYVKNNRATMTNVEIARLLFDNPKLKNIHKEARAVRVYNESLGPSVFGGKEEEPVDGEWRAPNTIDRTIARVNKYFKAGGGIDNKRELKASTMKEVEALMRYLNTYRLNIHLNNYESQGDRTLLESTFIRYCYDKADLTEEEVDQYILLSKESVTELKTDERKERLQALLSVQADAQEDEDKARVSMSLVEAIGKVNKEYDDCTKRQQSLLSSLKQKRSDRLAKKMSDNASILNIIATWRNEKTRRELIEIAETRKDKVKKEIERLENMDDVFAKIVGISQDEALYG
jgi:hypothetical protein